ncbi:MAG: hypothetical protein AB7Q16_01120 [Vicinamibacterales bacterium]
MRTALLLLTCAAIATPALAATDRQTRTFAWSPERALTIDITIGQVRIEGSARQDLEVAIQRTAPAVDALAQLPVSIDETTERVAIRILQPDGGTDPALVSDLVLRVPANARIERVKVMEGKLQIDRFRGTITADVRRGPIEGADVSGTIRLETGIGSLTLRNARLDPGGLLRLRAFNGDVRLQMPGPPSDARVMALALNGSVQSDIPMTTRDSWGPRWSEATLGTGEPVISIDVVTGKVEIRTK